MGMAAGMALERGLAFQAEYFTGEGTRRFSGEASWTLSGSDHMTVCPGVALRRWRDEGSVSGRDLTTIDLQIGLGYPHDAGEAFDIVVFGVPAVTLATRVPVEPSGGGEADRQFLAGVGTSVGVSLLFSRAYVRGTTVLTTHMAPLFGIGVGLRVPF